MISYDQSFGSGGQRVFSARTKNVFLTFLEGRDSTRERVFGEVVCNDRSTFFVGRDWPQNGRRSERKAKKKKTRGASGGWVVLVVVWAGFKRSEIYDLYDKYVFPQTNTLSTQQHQKDRVTRGKKCKLPKE